ncbi:membrane protein [Bacteroidia bacterium]|nr:membrane protein [Bacteroidia bacterium]
MKKINYILGGVLAIILTSACSESLLDIDNPNEPTVSTFWKTEDDAQKGINAAYSMLYKCGGWMRWLSFRYDLGSDEGWSSSPWNELAEWTHFNYVNYNFWEGNNEHWEEFYVGIFRANQVLKYVSDIPFSDATKQKQIIGQAEFLRALWYFQIVTLWENGTLNLEPQDGNYIPSDASEADLWAQIEIDLKAAMNNLPEKWDAANTGRATYGAAKALLAKAYMQQHKYAEAKTELQWFIDKEGDLYGLVDDYMDNFTHYNENNKEGIFEIQFDDKNKGDNGNNASMATGFERTQFYAPGGIGWADGKARAWLIGEYKKETRLDGKNDIRLYNNVTYKESAADFPDENPLIYGRQWDWGDDCFIRKYSTTYFRNFEDYFATNNFRIIRYADILLLYAECIAETGGSIAEAAVYVDKIRQRPSTNLAKLADSPFADCLTSKDKFLKRLQMERSLELCFEGIRWMDLKRWGLLDNQAGIDELKTRDVDFNNFVIGKHRRLPIPQVEVDNSGGQLTQNPMY